MSRHVVLIRINCNPNELLLRREKIGLLTDIFALTTSSDPAIGLRSLQNYCPFPCELIHIITANSRAEDLEKTLQIKFNDRHLHSFWYILTPDDVALICSITPENLMRLTGMIKRQLAPPPQIQGKPLPSAITDLIDKCNTLLDL